MSHASHGPRHHRPPTLGSNTFQYAYPEKRLEAAHVFDPVPPAPGSKPVHEYTLIIEEGVEHEVAPGIKVPSWTFNGFIPGPVIRAREGERPRHGRKVGVLVRRFQHARVIVAP